MTHTVETRIKLSIHRYASRLSMLEIEGTADKNLFSFRKLFAADLKTSYLKYALVKCEFITNITTLHILVVLPSKAGATGSTVP